MVSTELNLEQQRSEEGAISENFDLPSTLEIQLPAKESSSNLVHESSPSIFAISLFSKLAH